MERERQLRRSFAQAFGSEECMVVQAPGRVNIIGEHTDYNQGFVLPTIIERDIMMAAQKRLDRRVHLYSLTFDEWVEFSLDDIRRDEEHPWSNYIRGVAQELKGEGYHLTGMNACIAGNVPIGAGLSSSAAMEVAAARAFSTLGDFNVEDLKLAQLCRRAEQDFVGVRCGIMDQFAAVFGQRDHALFLDCRTLEYGLVKLPTPEVQIVICDTMVRRDLVTSEYNQRRWECEEGVHLLKEYLPGIVALRDISIEDFEGHGSKLPPTIAKRCEHVIYENQRVLDAIAALEKGHLTRLGELLRQSHLSLRDKYEVSCPELDILADMASQTEGVIGGRLTGAGFGGCTVNLVHREAIAEFRRRVEEEYTRLTGQRPAVYL